LGEWIARSEGRAMPQNPAFLKTGAPDTIRTCDLCLRRDANISTNESMEIHRCSAFSFHVHGFIGHFVRRDASLSSLVHRILFDVYSTYFVEVLHVEGDI